MWRMGTTKSYFKFENWWLTTMDLMIELRLGGSLFASMENRTLSVAKLRALKAKLKEWSKTVQGN
ncbi:hypothetical protein H5410_039876 [Solanum commersonii]|uniref:Uncharacterized protein n=1 Tax=Solanum commersonii TaxID=4109 RepID=A0A9J5XNG2_SOLCO|nr:hypothetical protein H5410_039876 [Solanum commersonii]